MKKRLVSEAARLLSFAMACALCLCAPLHLATASKQDQTVMIGGKTVSLDAKEVSLSKTALTDDDLRTLAQMPNLTLDRRRVQPL